MIDITLLGTSALVPLPDRALTAVALTCAGHSILFDCGEGTQTAARKAGVSEFVIGLTIVGFGTSCPELVVSLTGALEGNADVAVGNVLGSNIFNVLFILGLTALPCLHVKGK